MTSHGHMSPSRPKGKFAYGLENKDKQSKEWACLLSTIKDSCSDLSDGSVDKNPSANTGDTCSLKLVWEDSTCCEAKPVYHNY